MTRLMTGRPDLKWSAIGGLVTLIYLLPVYWMLSTSFKPIGEIFATPPTLLPIPPAIQSYTEVAFGDGDVTRGLVNTAIIATGTTALTLGMSVPAAFALARLRLRFVGVVLMLFLVVQMVPSVNIALPMFAIFSKLGLVNTYGGLIIANTSLAVPLAIVILRPYFLSVPGEILEAASIDGCNTFSAFMRVAVPVSVPGIITVAMITFLQAWGEFVFGLALATDERMQPITVVLAGLNNAFGTRWNDVMAVSAVVALPVILAFVFLQRYIVTGLTEGASKG
jgi:multiple sugar transport system permease protein